MFAINVMRADRVLIFAAEELKKYLRMMMPECGEIGIISDPGSREAFCLGLTEDFGLEFDEVKDSALDDLVHIDTRKDGGVIAGSNRRSVLFAVYRFLTENGCLWLYPGVDGEYIPVRDVAPTKYHKLADYRFRGFCNEGSESQQCMLDTIDFYPKLGLNVYMLEFDTPYYYYDRYYSHYGNDLVRKPEPVSKEQVKQWKRMCEAEISKRGLQFHDMGHGWTADPFGFDSSAGWKADGQSISEGQRRHLAMVNGKRDFFGGVAMNTNLCMSDPDTRSIMANYIADYAQKHTNSDFIHVWLADNANNHCECAECRKMRPSDYYIMIMNELDEILTARKLDTRIVFISYVDTMWGPEKIAIKNPKRFSLLCAGASMAHSALSGPDCSGEDEPPFIRNRLGFDLSAKNRLALIRGWQRTWNGPCFSYEYHFHKYQYYDPGAVVFSRELYGSLRGMKSIGIDGFVEDGSQRSFFPNGLAVFTFARTLFDQTLSFQSIFDEYMNCAYGEKAAEVSGLLEELSRKFDAEYMRGSRGEDKNRSELYAPSRVGALESVADTAGRLRSLAVSQPGAMSRVRRISYRLLELCAEYCELLSAAFAAKAAGNDGEATRLLCNFQRTFGRHEYEIERYFDQGMMWATFRRKFLVPDDLSFVEGI